MKALVLFWGVFLCVLCSFAQNQDQHPIDSAYHQCNDTAIGSYNYYLCTEAAYDAWDAELNRVYKRCMKELNEEEREILRKAQRIWIQHRDSELEIFSMFAGKQQGKLYRDAPIKLMEITRSRALQLDWYLSILLHSEE